MPDLLLYGDTVRSAALRHEVPLAIIDPLLWLRRDGRVIVMTSVLERERIAEALPDAELILFEELGYFELLAAGMPREQAELEAVLRAVERAGLRAALVPPDLPVAVADRLRESGIEVTVDAPAFAGRRRAKNPAELEGIRRAQRAAEAGMAAVVALLREAEPDGDRLTCDGAPLTAERVRATLREACAAAGAPAPPDVMVTSAWSGGGHDPGAGPLPAHLPIEIDVWPCDEESGCWADMTRTFVVGEIRPEVVALRDTARAALEAARAAVRPGVTGRALYDIACDVIEAAGHPTRRQIAPGESLDHGFYFSLGHGVGLEVHEEPGLGLSGHEELVPGDVLALEPGIEGTPVGGVRFEDLVLVTESGGETLTDFPYDLTP